MKQLLVAAALVFTGCGGGAGDDKARTVQPTSTTAAAGEDETTTTEEPDGSLAAAMLTLEDLPAGWTASPPDADDTTDEFCEGEDPFTEIQADEEVEASFQQSDVGPFIASFAEQHGSDDEAQEALDLFVDAVNSCGEFTNVEEDGTETIYRFSPLSFPQLGDDTFAARLSGTTAFGPITADFVFARDGDRVGGIVNAALGAMDSSLTEPLMRKVMERL